MSSRLENIRKLFATPVTELYKTFINRNTADDYSDNYYGEVVSNSDPKNYGRIKVKVQGIYDNIQTQDIPWAYPTSNFIGSNTGSLIIPPVGTIVIVRFQNKDIHQPIYFPYKVHTKNSIPTVGGSPNQIVFFETDDDDYWMIDTNAKEMKIVHSSKASITFKRDGTVQINASKIEDTNGLSAVPGSTPLGHYCALPVCPYSGQIHVNSSTLLKPIL